MQHNKNNKKFEQIGKVSENSQTITTNLSDVVDKFNVKNIISKYDAVKRCGILISNIQLALLILPFWGVASVSALFKSGLNEVSQGQKDVFYDAKNNEKIGWRALLFSVAKRFKFLVKKNNEEIARLQKHKQITAIICDDTPIEKTGKFIEGIGYVYDHVSHTHILGYKLLTCGYWDGASFIPLDFSLHKESRNNKLKKAWERAANQQERVSKKQAKLNGLKQEKKAKEKLLAAAQNSYTQKPGKTARLNLERKQRVVEKKKEKIKALKDELKSQKEKLQTLNNQHYDIKATSQYGGLKKEQYQKQFKKQREKANPGYKRKKEASDDKISTMIRMIKRAIKHGFLPDYVITDSWFFCFKLLKTIKKIGRSLELVSMATIGKAKYNILPDNKLLTPQEIISRYERQKGKNSRKYKARYIPLQAEYQGIRVKIFLLRIGRQSSWRLLVTTDLKMSFTKLIEIYKIRWTIEVFFKECKQYLLLGKCQSQDFDAQIADTTLSMIRYILLSYLERTHAGTTIGDLFNKLSQSAIEENLLAKINKYFIELLQLFADRVGIDFIEFYEDLLRTPEAAAIFEKINLDLDKQAA